MELIDKDTVAEEIERKCSECYYANPHGSFGECGHPDNKDTIYTHGSKIERDIASKCPHFKKNDKFCVGVHTDRNNPDTRKMAKEAGFGYDYSEYMAWFRKCINKF